MSGSMFLSELVRPFSSASWKSCSDNWARAFSTDQLGGSFGCTAGFVIAGCRAIWVSRRAMSCENTISFFENILPYSPCGSSSFAAIKSRPVWMMLSMDFRQSALMIAAHSLRVRVLEVATAWVFILRPPLAPQRTSCCPTQCPSV